MRAWLLAPCLSLLALPHPVGAADLLVGNFNGGEIAQFDGATGDFEGYLEPLGTTSIPASASLKVGPDGQLWVGSPGALRRFDLATGGDLGVFVSGLTGSVLNFVFAPDGSVWGTLGPGNNLFHADGTTGALLGPLVPTTQPIGVDIGPDGKLYVSSWTSQQISRFDVTTGAFLGSFPVPIAGAGVAAIRFGPDGKLYAAIGTGTDIVRFDGATGEYLGPFIPSGDPHPTHPYFFTWGPDGHLYVGSNGSDEVLKYDGATGAFLGVFVSGPPTPSGLVFVPDRTAHAPTWLAPVPTTSGQIVGALVNGVRTYKGIPYAEPPTGARRWRRPVRKGESPTPIQAFFQGRQCPQPGGGSEDCLKLSIWRPDSPPATPLPVLVFIHGGGLWTGSAGGTAEASQLALAQNLIVVEPQYRLGVLGFFGLPALRAEDASGSTGNYGLLDQLEALRWVRDNIGAFGGDPNNVTLSGQSAGGVSVCALMASPLSDGLFQRGLAMSGCTAIAARALEDYPTGSPLLSDPLMRPSIYKRSGDVAAAAGCPAGAAQLDCLRGTPAEALVNAHAAQPRTIEGSPPTNPAIDGYVLTEQPQVLLGQGAADGRALMLASVANESTYFTRGLEATLTSQPDYELAVNRVAGSTRANAVLPIYPAANFGGSYAEAFRALLADSMFVCPTLDVAGRLAAAGSPAWVYHLSFAPTYPPGSANADLRTFHGLDLAYLFGTYASTGIVPGPGDAAISAALQAAVGSYARTGTPVATPSWPGYPAVPPADLASASVLQLDVPNSLVSAESFRAGRCAALAAVANQLDPDRDIATSDEDNCPVTANSNQADADADQVGDACDNCRNVANPRVASDYLTTNPWATLTGGQRDDDHDGYGNLCDAKFPGTAGVAVGPSDLTQFRASLNKSRTLDVCGTTGNRPCAIFDLDEVNTAIGPGDLARFRLLLNKVPGPKCPTCPLACTAGTAGSCP